LSKRCAVWESDSPGLALSLSFAIAHYHLNEVKSWGTPKPTPQPEATITEQKAESRKVRQVRTGNFRATPPAALSQAAA